LKGGQYHRNWGQLRRNNQEVFEEEKQLHQQERAPAGELQIKKEKEITVAL